eukprot:Awhi_evm2s12036
MNEAWGHSTSPRRNVFRYHGMSLMVLPATNEIRRTHKTRNVELGTIPNTVEKYKPEAVKNCPALLGVHWRESRRVSWSKPEVVKNCQPLLILDDEKFEELQTELAGKGILLKTHWRESWNKVDAYKPEAIKNCQTLLGLDDEQFKEFQTELAGKGVL